MNIYEYNAKLVDGTIKKFSDYRDKVVLIVNVASRCGFTPQYKGLEALYQKYHDRGFEVLAFPCNQFGAQEPGDESEIKSFCDLHYGITFPLFSKIDVNGPNTHPLYIFLKKQGKGLLGTEGIKWNFTKFLVNRNGLVVDRFAPATSPQSLEKEIEKCL